MLICWDNQLIFASVCTYFWFTSEYTILSIFLSFSIQLFWSILRWHTCSFRYLSCPFLSLSHRHEISFLVFSLTQILARLSLSPWLDLHGSVSTSCVTRFIGLLCLSCYSIYAVTLEQELRTRLRTRQRNTIHFLGHGQRRQVNCN